MRRVWPVFIGREVVAQHRLHAKRGKKGLLDKRAIQADGILFRDVAIRGSGSHRRYGFKRTRLLSEIDVAGSQHEFIALDGGKQTEGHQAVFIRIRKTAEQDAIDDAEDRCR